MAQRVISVIGAGLAGCEAAVAAARRGIKVRLYEMKPVRYSPAHKSPLPAELVCSNSLKAMRVESASGLQKEEMRRLGSVVIEAADGCKVPAGGALAVDRERFSQRVEELLAAQPNIELIRQEVTQIPEGVCIIAAGPLCDGALAEEIGRLCGERPYFYDAVAPIVSAESIDMSKAFAASRYGRGEDDYINCPMDKPQYELFMAELVGAESAPLHGFDTEDKKVYEGCMPVEVLAARGRDAIRFGPLKPVGLTDPHTGRRPWAVVQLRAENSRRSMYNLVGFQTNLKFGEQKRVFSLIPGLENAEFLRYGVMHRNTYIDSPRLLSRDLSLKSNPDIFFAGQISGVEGYTESAMCGIAAGINAAARLNGKEPAIFSPYTMTGALLGYITDPEVKKFAPMGANFGILPSAATYVKDKTERGAALAQRALAALDADIIKFNLGEAEQQ